MLAHLKTLTLEFCLLGMVVGCFQLSELFVSFFLGVAPSWQGGLLSTPPGRVPQGKKTIPIVEHGPEWSEYIVEVWAIFWTTPAVNRKISSLSGGRVQLQPKGNPQTFFSGRLPHGVPPCAWVIFPWKVPFLENEFSFWNDLGSCSKSWFLVHVSIWLIGDQNRSWVLYETAIEPVYCIPTSNLLYSEASTLS